MEAAGGQQVLSVELGPRSYDILVGAGLLQEAGSHLSDVLPGRSAIVVTDRTVAELHLEGVLESLREAGFSCSSLTMEPGEASKDLAVLGTVLDDILSRGLERTTALVALGGGVVGDIAGFAASVLLRGVPYVQIPTTLLAQVDSAVGGKTGVNSPYGKNLIGSIYQPRLVLADVAALETLPLEERRAGYAEVAKYGLIDNAGFFAWLERNGERVVAGDSACIQRAVLASCAAKARMVTVDERERGRRALLNFGHTFGHALEAATGYDGSLLHGEAVAYGLVLAHRLSARLGLCHADDAERVAAHFKALGLPSEAGDLPARCRNRDALIALMQRDKKVGGGRVRFILTRGIGRAFLSDGVPREALVALLDEAFADPAGVSRSVPLHHP